MRSSVVLPAPLGPSTTSDSPAAELEADAVERRPFAVVAAQPGEARVAGPACLLRGRASSGDSDRLRLTAAASRRLPRQFRQAREAPYKERSMKRTESAGRARRSPSPRSSPWRRDRRSTAAGPGETVKVKSTVDARRLRLPGQGQGRRTRNCVGERHRRPQAEGQRRPQPARRRSRTATGSADLED